MNVPFVDLKKQYATIKEEIHAALHNVMENTAFVLGNEVRLFENEFAQFCGTRYAVAVNSGTSALHLSFLASGINAGDEVITVSNTFIATVEAIVYTGATPVFVDIIPETYLMNPDRIESAITERTKAIVPVHLYGQPANMDAIMKIADRYGIAVIEDACQAHGAKYNGKRVGSFGAAGCFSFYPGKNLGAYGEGGMIVTNDENMFDELIMLRDHGSKNKYFHKKIGYNYRMDGFQGAVLRVKLKYLNQWNEARRRNALYYHQLLSEMDICTPANSNGSQHVYHLYVVRVKHRERLQQYLNEHGIATGLHYPIPAHFQEACRYLGYRENAFPISEQYAKEILSLPMYAELSEKQVEYVVEKIGEFFDS